MVEYLARNENETTIVLGLPSKEIFCKMDASSRGLGHCDSDAVQPESRFEVPALAVLSIQTATL